MVTISNIAQQILDENNYTEADISKTNLEYLIDNAIDYINLVAGTSIADLSGTAGSKSLTATENEIVAIKLLTVLLLRAYKDRGPNASVAGLNVSAVINDPQYTLFKELFDLAVARLRGKYFKLSLIHI